MDTINMDTINPAKGLSTRLSYLSSHNRSRTVNRALWKIRQADNFDISDIKAADSLEAKLTHAITRY